MPTVCPVRVTLSPCGSPATRSAAAGLIARIGDAGSPDVAVGAACGGACEDNRELERLTTAARGPPVRYAGRRRGARPADGGPTLAYVRAITSQRPRAEPPQAAVSPTDHAELQARRAGTRVARTWTRRACRMSRRLSRK